MTAAHHTTRCPNCQTAYRVTQEQLGAADGMVRCSKCLTTFNGIDCLISRAPAPALTPEPQPPTPQPTPAAQAAPEPQPEADEEPDQPSAITAISASRDDDDDLLIDDHFDISKLVDDEDEIEPTPSADEPAAPEEAEAEREEATEEPETDPESFPTDRVEPTFTAQPIQEDEPPADIERAPDSPPQPAAATTADETPDTGRVWPTIGWSAGIRSDKSEDDPILFSAGAPIAPLSEELDSLALDKRAMSRWRPATHNIIPEAGLIGRPPRKQTLQTWLWFLGSLLAATTFAVQLIYFNSLLIHKDSALSPLTITVCETLGCPLPPSLDVDKILSTDLIIRSHPYTQGALLVDAVVVNTADFPQPFPPLTLAFEDLQGVVVARRTFTPAEYLMGELEGLTEMPSKQPVKLELEIVDPGKDAVSFRLFIAK